MMRRRFKVTVAALAEVFTMDAGCPSRAGGVADSIFSQYARMTDYVRLPLRWLTIGFDLEGYVHGGRPFCRLGVEAKKRQVRAWRESRWAWRRDLIRFYESLATMVIYGSSG